MNSNQKAICDKVANVNRLIKYNDGIAPPHSFELRNCQESIKVTKQSGLLGLLCSGLMIVNSLLFLSNFRKYILLLAILGVVSALLSMISAWNMEKNAIASVNGGSITVKGRTYDCSDITEIKKVVLNNIKLVSNGKPVLNVNKACDGCCDLIRWAKQYNIPINDDSDDTTDGIQKKQNTMVATILLICVAVAFMIVFLKKM